ncbi:MAG: hypothetical protein AAGG75_03175 [Bacteroidota bacterium]
MGNELKAGSQKNTSLYASSMAQAMEDAFLREWPAVMGQDAPNVTKDLKLIFVAIAQGVIKHLEENKDAFILEEINNGGVITTTRMQEITARQGDFS